MDPELVTIIKDGGIAFGAILLTIAIAKGYLWPKAMVDKVIEAQRETSEATAKIIATELGEKMKNGVAEGMEIGIARGYLKINDRKE